MNQQAMRPVAGGPSPSRDEPPGLFHLKRVAKIALVVGCSATLGLLAVVFVIHDPSVETYIQVIGTYAKAEQQLRYTLWFFGLVMLAIAGVATWLIALYSSFRIAGPLFRFSRNLEMEIARGPTRPIPVRRTDHLQWEAEALQRAVETLQIHYGALRAEAELCMRKMDEGAGPEAAKESIERLKELDQHVVL